MLGRIIHQEEIVIIANNKINYSDTISYDAFGDSKASVASIYSNGKWLNKYLLSDVEEELNDTDTNRQRSNVSKQNSRHHTWINWVIY